MKHLLLLAAVATSLTACGAEPGGTEPGEPGVGASTDALLGEWSGYVESFTFDDQTDKVTLSLDEVGQDVVTGHVTFGERPLYAPPSDPEVGYPPSFAGTWDPHPFTGVEFPITGGTFDGERLQISIARNQVWADWCAMQTPIADEVNPDGYWCVPNWGYSQDETSCSQPHPVTGEAVAVDCGKLFVCYQTPICQCTEASCAVESHAVTFDIAVDGDEADGSVDGLTSGLRTIRLSR